jgi:glycosyltransferase involved in cell wall biosynthesis
MNIGILLDRLAEGSYTKIAIEEVRSLRKLGHNAKLLVIIRDKNIKYRYQDIDKDVPKVYLSDRWPALFKLNFKIPFFSFFSFFHLSAPVILLFFTKVKEYDCIISHGTYTCFSNITLSKFKKIPYVAYIHDSISYILTKVYSKKTLHFTFPILIPLSKFLDKAIIENSRYTLVQSSFTKDRLSGLSDKKIRVLALGCNPAVSIPENREDFFLAVTKWDIGKTPSFILKVLKNSKNKFKLVIAGFWTNEKILNDFKKEVLDSGLGEWVDIRGEVTEDALKKLYLSARAIIHPIVEAFGLTILEAAGCGCPAIIPSGSGVSDIFTHGKEAFFPQEGDLDEYLRYV